MIDDNESSRISGNCIINTFKVVTEQTQITEPDYETVDHILGEKIGLWFKS